MLPLLHETHFTFRFDDDRIIPRFHLEGAEPGKRMAIIRIDASTGNPLSKLGEAVVGAGGWVDLPEPIHVRAGDSFSVIPLEVA